MVVAHHIGATDQIADDFEPPELTASPALAVPLFDAWTATPIGAENPAGAATRRLRGRRDRCARRAGR